MSAIPPAARTTGTVPYRVPISGGQPARLQHAEQHQQVGTGGCQVPPRYMTGRSGSPARPAGRSLSCWLVLRQHLYGFEAAPSALPMVASSMAQKTAPPLTLIFPGKTIGIYRKDGAERDVPWIEPGHVRARFDLIRTPS